MATLNEKGYYVSDFTSIKAAVHVVQHDANTDLSNSCLGDLSNKIFFKNASSSV